MRNILEIHSENVLDLVRKSVISDEETNGQKYLDAVVVDREDPRKLGRVRVRVHSIHSTEIPDGVLPWAVPHLPMSGIFSLSVPQKGANIKVYFDNDDIYSPVYHGQMPSADFMKSVSDIINENYPDIDVVFRTDDGTYLSQNNKNGTMKLRHSSGSTYVIDADGNVFFSSEDGEQGIMHINGKLVKIGASDDTTMVQPFIQGLKFMEALSKWVNIVMSHSHNGIAPPDASLATASVQFLTDAFLSLTSTTLVKEE